MSTIFVQIASYRDPELMPTLRDCLAKASRPHDLRFGICWQRDETETLGEFASDRRFRVITVDYRDSQGACWARHALQTLYGGETYTLQLDSHHRFAPGWDDALIDMLGSLKSEKPLLTTYLPPYDPASGERAEAAWIIGFDRFSAEGILHTKPKPLTVAADEPFPARFYSAHFAFTVGQFCEEVKHDPKLYFFGEEITLAVRAFTHGYDLFHPHRTWLWHEYIRTSKRRHWDDHVAANGAAKAWHLRDAESQRRCRMLLGMEPATVDFGPYGLGTARTLADYQRYSGIHFALRLVQTYTLKESFPPNPELLYGLDEWLASCSQEFETTIAFDRRDLPAMADWDFWYTGLHDQGGTELMRNDLQPEQITALLSMAHPTLTLRYRAAVRAATWTLWPHGRTTGWLDKVTGPITEG